MTVGGGRNDGRDSAAAASAHPEVPHPLILNLLQDGRRPIRKIPRNLKVLPAILQQVQDERKGGCCRSKETAAAPVSLFRQGKTAAIIGRQRPDGSNRADFQGSVDVGIKFPGAAGFGYYRGRQQSGIHFQSQ